MGQVTRSRSKSFGEFSLPIDSPEVRHAGVFILTELMFVVERMLVRCSFISYTLFLKILDLMTLLCPAMTTYSINGHITTSVSQRRAAMAEYNCKIHHLHLEYPAGYIKRPQFIFQIFLFPFWDWHILAP